jgi:regulator of protease activity HflC (stomatin/prohibitin superfamily)
MKPLGLSVFGTILLLLVLLLLRAIRIVQQYERGVIFVLGRLTGAKGPGLFLVPAHFAHEQG